VEAALSARDEILNKVRAAIEDAPPTPDIPRDYRKTTDDGLQTFFDRLAHYEATTHRIGQVTLAPTVREILGVRKIVTPAGIPEQWVENAIVDDPPLSNQDLDACDGVITTCTLAIAQTGTIVLDGGPGMGRRALTLVPDYHLCVVRGDQIVSSVPEAINHLTDPTRPLTFISGPSATVDIEMVRVRGVHGPRRLEVIVVTEPSPDPHA
jgi:L-lactate dehydrogenase complex protein LldG